MSDVAVCGNRDRRLVDRVVVVATQHAGDRSLAVCSRLRLLIKRVRSEGFTPDEFHKICIAALVLVGVIVVTGAAVRLTGSGLGCNDWPNCNENELVDVSSQHSAIEQINRLFTFVVGLAVVLAALGAWVRRPRRRDLVWLSMALVAGIPAQGVVGAIVVWTSLNPFAVQLHFVLSMALVAIAVVLGGAIARAGWCQAGQRRGAAHPCTGCA